jgi:hypothetical protein
MEGAGEKVREKTDVGERKRAVAIDVERGIGGQKTTQAN